MLYLKVIVRVGVQCTVFMSYFMYIHFTPGPILNSHFGQIALMESTLCFQNCYPCFNQLCVVGEYNFSLETESSFYMHVLQDTCNVLLV